MPGYRLSPLAEQDLDSILVWTHEHFGQRGRLSYEALLIRAILDVAADPRRPGCRSRPELLPGLITYHLGFTCDHLTHDVGRVRNPRHFLLFRIAIDGCVEIGRVLHHNMELQQQLPIELRE